MAVRVTNEQAQAMGFKSVTELRTAAVQVFMQLKENMTEPEDELIIRHRGGVITVIEMPSAE